jgi:hypothetical protein
LFFPGEHAQPQLGQQRDRLLAAYLKTLFGSGMMGLALEIAGSVTSSV